MLFRSGLPGSRIESLHESADATLWVGTRSGLARRAADRFEALRMGVAQGIAGREGIASDRSGHLYLATERGLVTGTPAPGGLRFALVGPPPGSPEEPAASVYVDAADNVWYACGQGLCNLEGDQPREIGREQGLPRARWDMILGDLQGNLWVRSLHGLYWRPAGSRRFQLCPGLPESKNTYPTLALDPA